MDTVNVDCHQQEMQVTLSTLVPFHGMVYPRGLTKKSPCMAEFDVQLGDRFTYRVPLRSCNTMFIDTVCQTLSNYLFIFLLTVVISYAFVEMDG